MSRTLSFADIRLSVGPGEVGHVATSCATILAHRMGVAPSAIDVYPTAGSAVVSAYPHRLPVAVRHLVEAVNEGHSVDRGVFVLPGGVVVVNWVVRACRLDIESPHWQLAQRVAGVTRVALRHGARAQKFLGKTPWPGASAAATVTVVSRLQQAVWNLERGPRTPPRHLRDGHVLPDQILPEVHLAPGDRDAFRERFPDGLRVQLAASGRLRLLRLVLPDFTQLSGGLPRSTAVARDVLRSHDPGHRPLVYVGNCSAWTARAVRALVSAGARPAPILRVLAAFLDQYEGMPAAAMLPPSRDASVTDASSTRPPVLERTRWSGQEDALLLRFFSVDDLSLHPTTDQWDFLMGRLSPAHRDRARACARVCYLRKIARRVAGPEVKHVDLDLTEGSK